MLEDQSIQQLISWSENGDLFSVANPTAFSKLVLPQYFKHNNWQSFVRQLNMYGFHKVNDMIHSNLTSECQKWEFRHQNFRRGAVEELQNIKRKSAKSHHQYLAAAMPTSSVSTSSMGRLLLGSGHLQQQSKYQHQSRSSTNRSNQLDENYVNDPSSMDLQPNPIYQHVIRLEDRISQISQSHESLKSETDELKLLLTKQQTAMQDITDLLYTLTKNDSKITNIEIVENIRNYVNNIYDSMNSDIQYGDDMDYEYTSSKKRLEENWGTAITSQSPTAPLPPNSSTNSDVDTMGSRKSSLFPNENDTHRNTRSTTVITSNSDSGSNSSNSNNNNSNNKSTTTTTSSSSSSSNSGNNSNSSNSNSSGKKDSIPISSILSPNYPARRKQDDLQQSSSTPGNVNLNRLPSIDAVYMGPYPSDQHQRHHHHPRHHHQPHQRQPYPSSPSTALLSNSAPPKVDYERPIQSLPPIQQIQSYLDVNDSSFDDSIICTAESGSEDIVSTEPKQETRTTSPYLGLGKKSALLNPWLNRSPPRDDGKNPEPKRKCTER
ncbi:HSF-type DNA-binding-domain-containing protein [Absidia repens]|uniref:HSF-type DNA-binding-domain-containing protein n=1 Tax=Absidia repens TaxID=90262 RepID=A0A1X2J2I0_9FUNG|nr:HSF-type DNA-binding-domain-containing protein [Absidia repens]